MLPVRPHDDQIAADFLSDAEDFFAGVSHAHAVIHFDRIVRSIETRPAVRRGPRRALVWFCAIELDRLLSDIDWLFRDQFGFGHVKHDEPGLVLDSERQAAPKASFEFSEKSAANRIVRKGFMGVLRIC